MTYEALLAQMGELQTLSKALPMPGDSDADEAKIQAAAADGKDGKDKGKGNTPDPDEDNDLMGKSLTIQLDDGTVVEALDGTDLVKSLIQRMDTDSGATQQLIAGAFDALKTQAQVIQAQGTVLKSLQAELGALKAQGSGRRSVVSVAPVPPAPQPQTPQQLAKSMPADDFMAKAMSAQKAGRISGIDVAVAEGRLAQGLAVPEAIVKAVMSGN